MRRAALLVAVLAVGCTGSTGAETTVVSPAPTECPFGFVRADIIPASDLVLQLKGHVPASLPNGFGLAEAWGPGGGFVGGALWADAECREVSIVLSAASSDVAGGGPTVGAWTVTADAPGQCANAVLGNARCLGYAATTDDGTLIVQMMGLNRAEGDEIVLSIPT